MGESSQRKQSKSSSAVQSYIESVNGERRSLFDRLEAVVLGMYPDAEVSIAYGIPTYGSKSRRVGLGYRKDGVSFYPYSGSALDEFRERNPAIRTTKGSINFMLTDRVPLRDLKKVIKRAMERGEH